MHTQGATNRTGYLSSYSQVDLNELDQKVEEVKLWFMGPFFYLLSTHTCLNSKLRNSIQMAPHCNRKSTNSKYGIQLT